MGALVKLWIREHVRFIVGATLAVVAALVSLFFLSFLQWANIWALVVVAGVVLAGLHDTERGAK